MGILNWAKKQFLKVVQYEDDTNNQIIYKYPLEANEEFMKNSKLVVREGQICVLLVEGKLADIFNPGTYMLDELKNIPVLTSIKSWKYLFETPFTADVFFINTKQFMNNKWGTTTPILLRDSEFGQVRLRGYGTYSFAVGDTERVIKEMCGTMHFYTVQDIEGYLKKIIISKITDVIAEARISALDIATQYDELGVLAEKKIDIELQKIGLALKSFYIENLSLPEEVAKVIDERTQVGIMKDSMQGFAQYQSIKAMREAANQEGGLSGAGIGLGAGLGMGKLFGEAFSSVNDAPKVDMQNKCPKCGSLYNDGAKFCPNCGEKLGGGFCSKCGAKLHAGAKFCPECGEKQL